MCTNLEAVSNTELSFTSKKYKEPFANQISIDLTRLTTVNKFICPLSSQSVQLNITVDLSRNILSLSARADADTISLEANVLLIVPRGKAGYASMEFTRITPVSVVYAFEYEGVMYDVMLAIGVKEHTMYMTLTGSWRNGGYVFFADNVMLPPVHAQLNAYAVTLIEDDQPIESSSFFITLVYDTTICDTPQQVVLLFDRDPDGYLEPNVVVREAGSQLTDHFIVSHTLLKEYSEEFKALGEEDEDDEDEQ